MLSTQQFWLPAQNGISPGKQLILVPEGQHPPDEEEVEPLELVEPELEEVLVEDVGTHFALPTSQLIPSPQPGSPPAQQDVNPEEHAIVKLLQQVAMLPEQNGRQIPDEDELEILH